MAHFPLTDAEGQTSFFRHLVLINLRYWQKWVRDKMSDTVTLDRESHKIIKAISFALEMEETTWPSVLELIMAVTPHMERRGHWDTWSQVLSRAIAVAQQIGDVPGEVALSALLARLFFRQSRFKESISYYRRTIRKARQIGDRFNEARACTNLGYYYIEQGNWYRAEVLCCYALNLFEQIDSDHGRAHTDNHLGILYGLQSRWDLAQQHLERACLIWQTTGDEHGLMRGFINLSDLYIRMKRPNKALENLEKALHKARSTGEEVAIGTIYMNIGVSYRLKEDLRQAEVYARQAEDIFRRFSDEFGLAQVWENLGFVSINQGKWSEAISYLELALKTWSTLKNKQGQIRTLIHMVEYELAKENRVQATKLLDEVEQLIDQSGQHSQKRNWQSLIMKHRRKLLERSISD